MSEMDRVSIEDAVRIGMALHKEGHIDAARDVYVEILDVVPEQPDALHYLGVLSHQNGDSERGAELIRRAIELAPDNASMRSNYGNVLQELDRLEEAEDAYRTTLEMAPDLVDAHCNLGAVLRRQDRIDEAEVALRRAVELDPEHGDSHENLGNIYAKQRNFERAVEHYQLAARYYTGSGSGHVALNLADSLRHAGRSEDAIGVLRKCIQRDPEEPIARHMLAALTGEDVPHRASDAYVRKTFDSFARTFDDVLEGLHYRAPRRVVERIGVLLGDRVGGLSVLDAGCGTGLAGELLRSYAGRLVGVDLSPVMLEKAREKSQYDELVEAEITSYLQSSRGAFDVIACVDAFVYFGALDDALGAAHEALNPGGWVCFTVEKADSGGRVDRGYSITGSGRYQHAPAYIEELMASHGFQSVELEELIVRLEGGQAVTGLLVSGQRSPG